MSVTIEELEKRTAKIVSLRAEKEEIETKLSEVNSQLETEKNALIAIMEENNMDSYKGSLGTFTPASRFSVVHPKDQDRDAFFGYLKERGIFEDLVSVNSQKLTSWYKEQMEAARTRGDYEFKIPGINQTHALPYLSIKGATK